MAITIRDILVAKFKASLMLGKIPDNLTETMLKEAEREILSLIREEIVKADHSFYDDVIHNKPRRLIDAEDLLQRFGEGGR